MNLDFVPIFHRRALQMWLCVLYVEVWWHTFYVWSCRCLQVLFLRNTIETKPSPARRQTQPIVSQIFNRALNRIDYSDTNPSDWFSSSPKVPLAATLSHTNTILTPLFPPPHFYPCHIFPRNTFQSVISELLRHLHRRPWRLSAGPGIRMGRLAERHCCLMGLGL